MRISDWSSDVCSSDLWLEMRACAGASAAIRSLLDLAPSMATVLRDGQETEVPTAEVQADEIVVIRPGNKITVDGEDVAGDSLVEASMLTGAYMTVNNDTGIQVIGPTNKKQKQKHTGGEVRVR